MQDPAVQQANLLVGHIANNEIRPWADFANKKQVPFVNVNLPNDAGISNNPYMVILNSTLATHAQGIYDYLEKKENRHPLLYSPGMALRKPGSKDT